jgi:hypothetical protein
MTTLREELTNDPLGVGYAEMTNAEVETALNAKTRSRVVSRFITARTILAECADGATILDKLEAAAAQISAVKWAMRFLQQEGGVDVGHPATLSMIAQLTGPVLTAAEGSALATLAMQECSRAEELGVKAFDSDIRKARA